MLKSNKIKTAHIEFTSRCNLRCVFCFANQPEYRGVDLNKKYLDTVIDELISRDVKVVCISGHGETTIYPEWFIYADRLLENGKSLHIISNFAKKLSGAEINTLARFKSIEISCDSPDPELFARLRRGAEMATVIGNLERVKKAAAGIDRMPEISLSCVVTDKNVFQLMELAEFGKRLGIGHFNLCNLTKYPDIGDGINVKHITEMSLRDMRKARLSIDNARNFMLKSDIRCDIQSGLLDSLDARLMAMGAQEQSGRFAIPESSRQETADRGQRNRRYFTPGFVDQTRDCIDPWSFLQVTSRGEVLPCCWHHPIGNLGYGQSLSGVFNNKQIQELRHQLLSGELPLECRECPSRGWTTTRQLKRKVRHHLYNPIERLFAPRHYAFKIVTITEYPITYKKGWFDVEHNPDIPYNEWNTWRWIGKQASFSIPNSGSDFTLKIRGSMDKNKFQDQTVSISADKNPLDVFLPFSSRFIREYHIQGTDTGREKEITFSIETNRVFIPEQVEENSTDQRELGLQIYEIFAGIKSI